MEYAYEALLTKGTPAHIHIASVIASRQAVEHIQKVFPEEKTSLWCGTIDPELNAHSYIVPGSCRGWETRVIYAMERKNKRIRVHRLTKPAS